MINVGKGKLLGWGVAIATVVALVTAGTVYAASTPGPSATPSGSATHLSLSSAQMRSVLVPLSAQAGVELYGEPATLREAAASGGFDNPEGMTFTPRSCSSYIEDALGPMGSLDGWIQYGGRTNEKGHPDYFYHAVINIPGGVNLENVRAAAMRCSLGFMTLEGKFTGGVSIKQRTAPTVPGASSLALVGGTQFPQPKNEAEKAMLQDIDYPCDIGGELCPVCEAEVLLLASGNLLILTNETRVGYADQVATTILNNARALS